MASLAVGINSLSKKSDKGMLINDLNLGVNIAEIHALVGPKDAGKSMVLNMLIGTVKPTSGLAKIFNNRIGSIEAREITGYVPANPSFYLNMTVFEYLVYMSMLSGVTQLEAIPRANSILKSIDLSSFRDKKPSDLPLGMRIKVAIAQAMMSRPKLLLLDEPLKDLDKTARMNILAIVEEISRTQKTTVLVTAECWRDIDLIADTITFLNHGKVFLSGKTKEVRKLFNHGIFTIRSSDDAKLIPVLQKVGYIKKIIRTIDQEIIVITDYQERFQQELPGIVFKLDIALQHFMQQEMTYETIDVIVHSENAE